MVEGGGVTQNKQTRSSELPGPEGEPVWSLQVSHALGL